MTKRSAVHRALLLATSALLLELGGVASAHHSATAIYDGKKHVTITGTLSRLRWVNPHAILNVDVKKADNTVETWEFELHSPNEMQRIGWSRDMFKLGDTLTIEGMPARKEGVKRAFTSSVILPDGRRLTTHYDFGSSK